VNNKILLLVAFAAPAICCFQAHGELWNRKSIKSARKATAPFAAAAAAAPYAAAAASDRQTEDWTAAAGAVPMLTAYACGMHTSSRHCTSSRRSSGRSNSWDQYHDECSTKALPGQKEGAIMSGTSRQREEEPQERKWNANGGVTGRCLKEAEGKGCIVTDATLAGNRSALVSLSCRAGI
jgi:hypothetical protein